MNSRLFPSLAVAATVAVLLCTFARAADDVTSIKFSDPTKPGTLKVAIARGSLRVKGADVAEVIVKSDAKPVTSKAVRADGLRVLTAATSFALTEKDNVVTLDAASDSLQGSGVDFTVTLPRNSTVVVTNSWGGDIACSNLSGDVEVRSTNGAIRLEDVSGGVVLETVNGAIHASIRELQHGKPLSFQSTNGAVVIRLPAAAKANVRLRTQNGSVLTDFDETVLITKTEAAPRTAGRRSARTGKMSAVAPVAPIGPEAPAAPAVPGAPVAPRASTGTLDENKKEEIRTAVRESVRAGAEAAREALAIAREAIQAAHEGMAESGIAIKMPSISIATVGGGKLVTGTLNGGGPEISVATLNGDVTLRQLEKK